MRLLGRPVNITPVLQKLGTDGLADNATAVFEFPRALGAIVTSSVHAGANRHRAFEIFGSNGSAVLRPIEPAALHMDLAKPAGPYKAGIQAVEFAPFSRYVADFTELAEAVRTGRALAVTPEEELRVQEALLAASGDGVKARMGRDAVPSRCGLPWSTLLTQFPILTLFLVVGIGYFLGRVNFFGFRLGVAGVLFAGLVIGALGPELALPPIVSTLGLIIFIYTIGIQSGPGFVNPFSRQGYRDNLLAVGVLSFGALVALGLAAWLSLPGPTIAGLFSGALTNAPALAAAQELLRGSPRGIADQPVIGFGIAYPFGVVGVMLSFHIARRLWRVTMGPPEPPPPILSRDFVVRNPGIDGLRVADVMRIHKNLGFVVSRVRHDGETGIATPDTRLHLGDIVVAVGDEEALERAKQLFGEPAEAQIELDRSELDYRRVFVSNPKLAGKRIRDLDLQNRMAATITRVRRGDSDIVPGPDTRLEAGDRVRVLTYRRNFDQVAEFFGDSIRGTAETNFGSFGLGMALGVLIGMIPIPLPGGTVVRLGLAGGPLLVALFLGRVGRTGPITWSLPLSANLTLRQIGLVLFQAGVGTRAGLGFFQTLATTGPLLLLAGAAITIAVAFSTLIVATSCSRSLSTRRWAWPRPSTPSRPASPMPPRRQIPTCRRARTRAFFPSARWRRSSSRNCWLPGPADLDDVLDAARLTSMARRNSSIVRRAVMSERTAPWPAAHEGAKVADGGGESVRPGVHRPHHGLVVQHEADRPGGAHRARGACRGRGRR